MKLQPPSALPADTRREEVVRATCTVIARDGLDRTSLRAIAQELGSTTGVLTHYFRDKSDLLAFVLRAIISKLELDRSDQRDTSISLKDIQAMLRRYLPGTADNELWWRVWLAFTVASLSDSRQSDKHRSLYADLRRMWTGLLSDLKARGAVVAELDPEIEADVILSLVDGVGIQALISPDLYTPRHQSAIIETYLSRLAPS
jgi:AcrR family transcriptional regulator